MQNDIYNAILHREKQRVNSKCLKIKHHLLMVLKHEEIL